MFLQIAVPSDDNRCLQFLWPEDPEIGAKSWPTCANYALQQVAKDNAKDDENVVKAVQRNFYMDDFPKSVRTPEEAIEIYQKVGEILSRGGFNLTKWITSAEKVKSQIPEADRSRRVIKTFEAEPQSSSTLGLNRNVDADSLIAVVELSKKFQQKLLRELSYPLSQQCSTHLGYVHPSR